MMVRICRPKPIFLKGLPVIEYWIRWRLFVRAFLYDYALHSIHLVTWINFRCNEYILSTSEWRDPLASFITAAGRFPSLSLTPVNKADAGTICFFSGHLITICPILYFPQTSLSPSKDVPGFRKILPRASYFLLAKGCSSNSQSEVTVESLDPPGEGGYTSESLTQETEIQRFGLASEVELSEQAFVIDELAEETVVASHSTALHKIPPSSSSSILFTDIPLSKSSADLTANRVTLKGNETRDARSVYGGTMMQQIQGETTQMVAILPSQVRL